MNGEFGDEPITYRQHLIEEALIDGLDAGVDIFTAIEAVSSTLLANPHVDGDEIRRRRDWEFPRADFH